MKNNLYSDSGLIAILLILGLIFWILSFWLIASTEERSNIAFDIALCPSLMLNAYLIIRRAKESFNMLTTFSLMIFIGGMSCLKLTAANYSAHFYQEHFRAFRPDRSPTLFIIFMVVAAILELFLILGVLRFCSPIPFHLKKLVPFTLLLITFGDAFWWLMSSFIWIIFNMGGG